MALGKIMFPDFSPLLSKPPKFQDYKTWKNSNFNTLAAAYELFEEECSILNITPEYNFEKFCIISWVGIFWNRFN
jgi:hypothetical protein